MIRKQPYTPKSDGGHVEVHYFQSGVVHGDGGFQSPKREYHLFFRCFTFYRLRVLYCYMKTVTNKLLSRNQNDDSFSRAKIRYQRNVSMET